MKGTPLEGSHDSVAPLHDWCLMAEDLGQPKQRGNVPMGFLSFC